jgi:phospholipid/cholesterol/gamma-HCH transport system substrate-binding protein
VLRRRLRHRLPRRRAVALAVAAAVAGAVLPACTDQGPTYELVAWFPKAVSLYEQSDVKILGLSAGTVEEVEVVGTRVRVHMRIHQDQPVPPDVRATIVPLSLIGERYVQLFPVWREGSPRAEPGTEIPLERTSIPTEPDEALAALKKFLDALDPDATGRLVQNLADTLEGNGQGINDALREFGELSALLASKDDELVRIVEHFDDFTATLRTRERQIGQTLDRFATLTTLLSQERTSVEALVDALARLSVDGLDLVSEHGSRLDRDLTVLTRVLQSVRANLAHVERLLDAAPLMVAGKDLDGETGLAAAYDEKFRHLDLRNSTGPTLARLLETTRLPLPNVVCIEIDVDCEDPSPVTIGSGGGLGPLPPGLGRGTEESSGLLRRAARALAEVLR